MNETYWYTEYLEAEDGELDIINEMHQEEVGAANKRSLDNYLEGGDSKIVRAAQGHEGRAHHQV